MFFYCKKCALIKNHKDEGIPCDVCDSEMTKVPSQYLSATGNMFSSKDTRKALEDEIKKGEEFDIKLFENRDSILETKDRIRKEEISAKLSEYNETRAKLLCPICRTESLSRISNAGKVVKVGLLGILGAGDLGKTYKCNSCGYRF